jgi:hypothetical protein
MFYVEHMKNILKTPFLLFFLLFSVVSCQKRDPNPENSDVIYNDLKAELEIAQKNLAEEQTQNARTKKDLDAVVPQTGQRKYAQKRYFESLNNLDLYSQQAKYFEIALELRKQEAKNRYLESLTPNGRKWPDPLEIDDYRVRLKLQHAKLTWGKKDTKNKADAKPDEKATAEQGAIKAEAPSH